MPDPTKETGMAACMNCGHEVSGSAWECRNCGSQVATAGMIVAKAIIVAIFGGFLIAFIT